MSVDLHVEQVISHARLVIVRGLGGLDYWRYGFERIGDAARDNGILFAALPVTTGPIRVSRPSRRSRPIGFPGSTATSGPAVRPICASLRYAASCWAGTSR